VGRFARVFEDDGSSLGADGIYWYSPSGTDYMWLGRSGTTFAEPGLPKQFSHVGNFQPFTGDFDGNGFTDIFWYQPGSGADYIWMPGGLQPVAGNFLGDRMTDIIWNKLEDDSDLSSEEVWEFREGGGTPRTTTTAIHGFYTPLVGDFNSDSQSDVYWYRPR